MWNVLCPAGKSPAQAKYFFIIVRHFVKVKKDTNFKARGREGGRRDFGAGFEWAPYLLISQTFSL